MSYEELVAKWTKIIESIPYGQEFEFEIPDSEAQIVMSILAEGGDIVFTCEALGARKASYGNN